MDMIQTEQLKTDPVCHFTVTYHSKWLWVLRLEHLRPGHQSSTWCHAMA